MICLFNPEHDLCLANGNRNFVPPASALLFADRAASLMQIIYPEALCCSLSQLASLNPQPLDFPICPWGWNLALKTALLKQGVLSSQLPSDDTLDHWRRLQHRSTLLPLQPDCCAATSVEEVESLISLHHNLVLKAPWSGSGRGIRWISNSLSEHDRLWFQKMVREQRCVIVEPRRQIQATYALEYRVTDHELLFVGYSLFESSSGVYRHNLLLPDDDIVLRINLPQALRAHLESWLQLHIVPHYQGPLGVDFILTPDGSHHITELNLRHTMGLVAHEYLRHNPFAAHTLWRP